VLLNTLGASASRMRVAPPFLAVVSFLSVYCVSFVACQSNWTASAPQASTTTLQLPLCAVSCLATSLRNSTCSPTDTVCLCADVRLQEDVATCVLQNCSVIDALGESVSSLQPHCTS
jgi:hypothetical protein